VDFGCNTVINYTIHLNTIDAYSIMVMEMRKNLVRLSEFEYAQLHRAREELMRKGMANLPEIRPLCPKCGQPLDGFKVCYEYVRCSHCGYEEHSAALTAVGAFALGAIAALGAAALIYLLSRGR
jgi:hypothetical protein